MHFNIKIEIVHLIFNISFEQFIKLLFIISIYSKLLILL